MIYMVLGDTNAGKDTIAHLVRKTCREKIHKITPVTTRPKRDYEKDGVDYHFCTESDFEYLKDHDRFIYTYWVYTKHGLWWYGVEKQKFDDDKDYILTGNLTALKGFMDADITVIPIFINATLRVRKIRAAKRDSMVDPEVHRRLKDTTISDLIPKLPSEIVLDNNTYPEKPATALCRAIERCRHDKYEKFHIYRPDKVVRVEELKDKINSIIADNGIEIQNSFNFVERKKEKHENYYNPSH